MARGGTDDGRALVAPSEFGPFDGLADLAHALYVDGFSERAVQTCRAWVALTQAAGDVVTTRYLRYVESRALQELGRDAETIRAAEALLAELGDAVEPVWRAKALAVVAEACARQAEHSRAIAAVAEAEWLLRSIPAGSYSHVSAGMAVALALRTLNLVEQADDVLSSTRGVSSAEVEVHVAQELALLSAYWTAGLMLIGRDDDARARAVVTASRAGLMQRLAHEAGNLQMLARGELIEAYAVLQLGAVRLAAARARAASERFTARPELVETHLLHLILAQDVVAAGDPASARTHLEAVAADAERAGRDVWALTARAALAEVHATLQGQHSGMDLWRSIARNALDRVWSEREARFAALHDRNHLRELTAETDRIGLAVQQDPLTGLGNRRMLADRLEQQGDHLWALFVDLDEFKDINDQHSHAVGDQVLCVIADILREQCREGDVLIRYGGDEFLVLVAGGEAAADAVAERIHGTVGEWPWEDLAAGMQVTVSMGVGRPDQTSAGALAAADSALRAAKRSGRNRITWAGAPPV